MSKFLDSTGLSYTVTHIKDYIDKNKITVNDSTLTITNDGTTLGTFTSNQSSDATIDIPIQDKLDIETFDGIITTKTINLTCPGDSTSGIITKVIRSINSINILMLVYNLKGNYYSFDCASDELKSKYIGKFYEYDNKYYITNGTGSLSEIGSISGATSSKLGGIKVGYTTTGKNYKVQLDESYNAYVNVPWTKYSPTYSNFPYDDNGCTYLLNNENIGLLQFDGDSGGSTANGANIYIFIKESMIGKEFTIFNKCSYNAYLIFRLPGSLTNLPIYSRSNTSYSPITNGGGTRSLSNVMILKNGFYKITIAYDETNIASILIL